MTTKGHCLLFKDKQDLVVNGNLNDKFHNLNLNQNYNCFAENFQSNNVENHKVSNYDFSHNNDSQTKQNSTPFGKTKLGTSFANLNVQNNYGKNEESEQGKTLNANSSTLSLHITAYENSIEATSGDTINGEKGESNKKKENVSSIKNWKAVKEILNDSFSSVKYGFELPRQQQDQNNDPEVMQFKASQRLSNINGASSSSNTEHVNIMNQNITDDLQLPAQPVQQPVQSQIRPGNEQRHIRPANNLGPPQMKNMKQGRIRKEDRKEERRQKREAAAKARKDDGIIRGPDGVMCCIPLVKCSRIGHPLPQTLEEGIKLCCTNPDCLHTRHLVHQECFRSLERGLMTILQNQGSARGWTDGHRKHNLWGKKGLSLVQRSLRCPCGKGQMKRDDDAWMQREALLEPPKEKKDKRKAKPKATLPALQFAKKGIPPPIDLKKVHELDTHYLSSHSPPACEAFLEDRYGPLKISPPRRTRKITSNSITSNFTSISKTSASTKKKPIHVPIGLAPIKTPPKPLEMPKSLPRVTIPQLQNDRQHDDVKSKPIETVPSTNTMIPTSENLINNWENVSIVSDMKEEDGEEEEITKLPTPEGAMSPSNTTTSGISFQHSSNHYNYSFLTHKSMAVQTDETSFCKALIKDPWMKLYSPKEFHHDSRIYSIPCSPEFLAESFMRPLNPVDSVNKYIINGERIITPPPGFGTDGLKTLPAQPEDDIRPGNAKYFGPIPFDPVPVYSLFDGSTLELGEEILRRIHNRTLVNYDLVEYNFIINKIN